MVVVTLGTATLDIILKTKETIHEGSKIEIEEVNISLGGGALNAATTFKNLGLDYIAYFRLGKDLIGRLILEKIRKNKLKTKIFFHQGESQFSIVVLSKAKERTIFVYRGLGSKFNLNELNKIKRGDYYYLTTALTPPQSFFQFLKKIRPHSRLIALNPSKKFLEDRSSIKTLNLVDVLFVNEEEASSFLGYKDNPLNLGKDIFKKLKLKILVLTLGEKGSLVFFDNKIFQAGIFKPKKFIDTTGAGDAFNSAFFANLVLNREINEQVIKKSIIWGSANASANIEKLGAQIGLLRKRDYINYERKPLKIKIWSN